MEQYLNKKVLVKIDRPLHSKHPKHGFEYFLNYGFIPDTIQADGEEIDAYVIGPNVPVDEFEGKCIGYIEREDDPGDYKLIIVDKDNENISDEEISQLTSFQEKFFRPKIFRGQWKKYEKNLLG